MMSYWRSLIQYDQDPCKKGHTKEDIGGMVSFIQNQQL